jgi:hypothetical protein
MRFTIVRRTHAVVIGHSAQGRGILTRRDFPLGRRTTRRKMCISEIGRELKVRPIHHVEKFALFERSLQTRVAQYEKSGSTEKH